MALNEIIREEKTCPECKGTGKSSPCEPGSLCFDCQIRGTSQCDEAKSGICFNCGGTGKLSTSW